MTHPPSLPSTIGEFRIVRRLGEGGMGVVYLAEQAALQRSVALKVMHRAHEFFPDARRRFQREVETVAKLRHPGIVPVYVVGEHEGVPHFAMEYLRGASLAEALARLQGRDPRTLHASDLAGALQIDSDHAASIPLYQGSWTECCTRIGREVADALAHAHQHDVLHRDVKPSNVMLTEEGRVLLVDFGLASELQPSTSDTTQGSLPYLPPERLQGSPPTVQSDVYSLGLTLREALTLHPAFDGDRASEVRRNILSGRSPSPRASNPAIPLDLETVCLQASDVTPSQRYASAAALRDDLDHFLEFRPVSARRASALLHARRWCQRHPARTAAAVLSLLIVLVASPAVFLLERETMRNVSAALGREQETRRELETTQRELERESARTTRLRVRASQRLTEVIQLSDLRTVQQLRDDAATLWPMTPENLPAFDAWLDRAREAVARAPRHERVLQQLRSSDPQDPEIGLELGDLDWWIETLQRLTSELLALASEDADPYAATIPGVLARRTRAVGLRDTMQGDPSLAWQDAREEVELNPAYSNLQLAPQTGLVPLGEDPETGLWEFWVVQSGARPQRDPGTEQLQVDEESGLVLILVPGGEYTIGAQSIDRFGTHFDPDVQSGIEVQQVTLDPFFLSKYEMTQAQWERLTGENPAYFNLEHMAIGPIAPVLPVEQVSWWQCVEALRRLGLQLPTEAQWEVAARAATETVWWTGDDRQSVSVAGNLADQSYAELNRLNIQCEQWDDKAPNTAPVGSFTPNPFGFHHVIGNVAELCRDRYRAFAAVPARRGDGLRVQPGEADGDRARRGGAYNRLAPAGRSVTRGSSVSTTGRANLGCRPARALDRETD